MGFVHSAIIIYNNIGFAWIRSKSCKSNTPTKLNTFVIFCLVLDPNQNYPVLSVVYQKVSWPLLGYGQWLFFFFFFSLFSRINGCQVRIVAPFRIGTIQFSMEKPIEPKNKNNEKKKCVNKKSLLWNKKLNYTSLARSPFSTIPRERTKESSYFLFSFSFF